LGEKKPKQTDLLRIITRREAAMGMQEAGGWKRTFLLMSRERRIKKSLNRSPHILRKVKDGGKI